MPRYDVTNLFHFSEDLVTTFISLWLLQHAEPDAGGASALMLQRLMMCDVECDASTPGNKFVIRRVLQTANGVVFLANMGACCFAAGWEGAQLVIAEELPAGPFMEIWATLFPAHPIRVLAKVRTVSPNFPDVRLVWLVAHCWPEGVSARHARPNPNTAGTRCSCLLPPGLLINQAIAALRRCPL